MKLGYTACRMYKKEEQKAIDNMNLVLMTRGSNKKRRKTDGNKMERVTN